MKHHRPLTVFAFCLALLMAASRAFGAEFPESAKGLVILDSTVNFGLNAEIPEWSDGPKVDYQGVARWRRWGAVRRGAAAVFYYTGPAEQPAILSASHGAVLNGVNLWRMEYQNGPVVWDSSIGYKFQNPASSTKIADASIAGFDTAILFAKSNHTEHFRFENLHSCGNRVFFRNEENQANSYSFQNIFSEREMECLFQFADVPGNTGGGGNVSFDTILIQSRGLVLDIQKSNVNSCTFRMTNLKIDGGNMNGWKLVRQKVGPLNLYVRGHIGKDAPPAADAIDVVDKSKCDIELFWRGKIWPRDFEHDGTNWVLKQEPN